MQTDQSIDSATATTRRTFLTRAAVGGALVTAGAAALPHLGLTPAGARPADQGDLKDVDFADFGTAIELAAVTAYSAAFDKGVLDDEWSKLALTFQGHHQDVADTLAEMRDPDLPEAVAFAAFAKTSVDAIKAASDQAGVLAALSV
ncbi:MAG: twin-arginine translocation signal domain-containing protein, partial [Aquihabitans sp.]